jgi:hypothetical protein
MKSYPRVRHAVIAGLVLLGLLASSATYASECWIVCKCRTQCSTPCTDVGDSITCGAYGLCECNSTVARMLSVENPPALSTAPDPLSAILGTSCPAAPQSPGQTAAVGR